MAKNSLLIILFLLLLSYYTFVSLELLQSNYHAPGYLFYESKLTLERETSFFNFGSIDFGHPPLPYILTLLVQNPLLAATATGAALALFTLWVITQAKNKGTSHLVYFLFLFFSLPLLFLFTQELELLIYFFLFTLSNFFLARYLREEGIYDIFYFGLLYGLSYYVFFETLFLLPLYIFIIFFCTPHRLEKKFSLGLVAFLPLIFMVFSWSYLTWMYTGNWSFFTNTNPTYYRFLSIIPSTYSFQTLSNIISRSLLIALVYYAILPFLFFRKKFFHSPLLYIYFSPLLFLIIKSVSLGIAPAYHEYLLLIFIIPTVIYFLPGRKDILKIIFPIALTLTLVSGNIAFYTQENIGEKTFSQLLTGQQEKIATSPYQEISTILNKTTGNILMDDDILFPIIPYIDDTNRFILPYVAEFGSVLNNPRLFSQHVIMSSSPYSDRVARVWPPEKGIPGYYLGWEKDGIYFFTTDESVYLLVQE